MSHTHQLTERICSLRAKNNLTTRKMGELLGVSATTIVKWESGQTHPKRSNVLKICKVFQCSPSWLVYGLSDGSEVTDITNLWNQLGPEDHTLLLSLAYSLIEKNSKTVKKTSENYHQVGIND
jgi:HTH-type transcriptional regulator, cell division transcriptional repressor